MLRRIANVTKEAMAPIVERAAEVRATGEQLEPLRHRIEAKIIARHHVWLRFGLIAGTDLSPILATSPVILVVKAPRQVVHGGLHVKLAEAGEDFTANVCL